MMMNSAATNVSVSTTSASALTTSTSIDYMSQAITTTVGSAVQPITISMGPSSIIKTITTNQPVQASSIVPNISVAAGTTVNSSVSSVPTTIIAPVTGAINLSNLSQPPPPPPQPIAIAVGPSSIIKTVTTNQQVQASSIAAPTIIPITTNNSINNEVPTLVTSSMPSSTPIALIHSNVSTPSISIAGGAAVNASVNSVPTSIMTPVTGAVNLTQSQPTQQPITISMGPSSIIKSMPPNQSVQAPSIVPIRVPITTNSSSIGNEPLPLVTSSMQSTIAALPHTAGGNNLSKINLTTTSTTATTHLQQQVLVQQQQHHHHHQVVQAPSPASVVLATTAAPPPPQNGNSSPQQSGSFQRLKVEDALSYLDQVKFRFSEQPQVYNDFLDIMKEFKSQAIDTPGVIHRVSNLFRGHSELIVGFNTFLPPGYKIEIKMNEMNVSMPDATYTVLMNSGPIPHHNNITIAPNPAMRNAMANVSNNTQHQPILPTIHPPVTSSFSNALQTMRVSGDHVASHHNMVGVNNIPGAQIVPGLAPSRIETGPLNNSSLNSLNTASGGVVQANSMHHRNSGHVVPISISNSGSMSLTMGIPKENQQPGVHQLPPPQIQPQNSFNDPRRSPPLEFNHAITYVNKIKNRFLHQPETYKQFLDILQNYQKEQRNKETSQHYRKSNESEVYARVAKLFQNQEDLLEEFSQFLPEANSAAVAAASEASGMHYSNSGVPSHNASTVGGQLHPSNAHNSVHNTPQSHIDSVIGASYALQSSKSGNSLTPAQGSIINSSGSGGHHRTSSISSNNSYGHHRISKRNSSNSISISGSPNDSYGERATMKRSKLIARDNSIADAFKYSADLAEYAFFDKIRSVLSPLGSYDSFLRVMSLFNKEILSRSDLLLMLTPILGRYPELLRKFKEMIGFTSSNNNGQSLSTGSGNILFGQNNSSYSFYGNHLEGLGGRMLRDFTSAVPEKENLDANAGKRYGASYRSVVKPPMECSGRTELCREVLNDTLVSFPCWSEDSTFVTCRKTPYQDQLHQAEDERFELDLLIENNLSTIRALEAVQRKLDRLQPEDRANYKLDDCLGGNSRILHQMVIQRIYGEKGNDIVDALKNSPANVVPVVLRRLLSKEEEWREQQRIFNKHWRELNEKCYLKSLDHQAVTFKQNDSKIMKPKAMLTEIEEAMNRLEAQSGSNQTTRAAADSTEPTYETFTAPHMVFVYPNKEMIEVASNLIIHHVKRLTATNKEDKQKIKQLLRHFIPDLFDTERGVLSDDDADDEETSGVLYKPPEERYKPKPLTGIKNGNSYKSLSSDNINVHLSKSNTAMLSEKAEEEYALFYMNENWYYFFRLHYILCERLAKMAHRAKLIAEEERTDGTHKKESTALLLRLKTNLGIDTEYYFEALVEMVTQVMDGNLDSNQYEDTLREMFGIHAYFAFTLDKVVQNIVRQLQQIVADEEGTQCIELYLDALKIDGAGGPCLTANQRLENEAQYHKNAEQVLVESDNYFKMIVYKQEAKISIEMLESPNDEDESEGDNDEEGSNQSLRTLRSSAKNNAGHVAAASIDEAKVIQLANERIKASPRFLKREIERFKKLYSKKKDIQSDATGSKEDDEEKQTLSNDEKDGGNAAAGGSKTKDVDIDLEECQFNLKNFQRIILVHKDIFMSKDAFKVARQTHSGVTKRKYAKFAKWYGKWTQEHMPSKKAELYRRWMRMSDTTGFTFDSNQPSTTSASDLNNNKKMAETMGTSASSSGAAGVPENKQVGDDKLGKSIDIKTEVEENEFNFECVEVAINEKKPPYRSYCRYVHIKKENEGEVSTTNLSPAEQSENDDNTRMS